ncbi:MAG: FHA domain-containing protein [Chloroflexi bacterium]|nr:MAG: FHA domain-containing protein [Chloroflexota bacterium]MBL1194369.1 FHA domain-containing protein [Chloroflexota bacterium]NOH11657.1 FHA domain-containing protein [Chloroflexota bacterium]
MIIENQRDGSKELARPKKLFVGNNLQETALNDDWLNNQPKSRLIEVIKVLANRLEGETTGKIDNAHSLNIIDNEPPISIKPNGNKVVVKEIIVPAVQESQFKNPELQWELTFIPKDSSHRPLQIHILGNFTIGRNEGNKSVDLDLASLRGDELGMSRQHAAIRVSGEGLYLIDLGSTNGTFYRGKQLEPGNPVQIFQHGSIAFGGLLLYIGNIQKLKPVD